MRVPQSQPPANAVSTATTQGQREKQKVRIEDLKEKTNDAHKKLSRARGDLEDERKEFARNQAIEASEQAELTKALKQNASDIARIEAEVTKLKAAHKANKQRTSALEQKLDHEKRRTERAEDNLKWAVNEVQRQKSGAR